FITCQLNETVIRADPNLAGLQRRWRDGVNDRLALVRLPAPHRQVWTDRLPTRAAVRGLKQRLRCLIERVRRQGREGDGRRPRITIARLSAEGCGRRRDVLHLMRAFVEAIEFAAGRAAPDYFWVHRIRQNIAALACANRIPIAKS